MDEYGFDPAGVLFFSAAGGYDKEMDVAEVTLWDKALTK
jgi:hypothetical protein